MTLNKLIVREVQTLWDRNDCVRLGESSIVSLFAREVKFHMIDLTTTRNAHLSDKQSKEVLKHCIHFSKREGRQLLQAEVF